MAYKRETPMKHAGHILGRVGATLAVAWEVSPQRLPGDRKGRPYGTFTHLTNGKNGITGSDGKPPYVGTLNWIRFPRCETFGSIAIRGDGLFGCGQFCSIFEHSSFHRTFYLFV